MTNDYLMDQPIADGALVRVLREFETPPVPITALHLPTRTPSAAVRAFTGVLRRRLADMRTPNSR